MLTWLRDGVQAFATLYLGGIAAARGARALGSERAGWPAFLRELELLLFAPLPLLLIVAMVLRARGAVVVLLVPLTVLTFLIGPRFAPKAPAPAGGPHIRVLSFNVGAARGLTRPAAVVQAIRASGPDVVCLVEAPANTEATIGDALRDTYPHQAGSASVFVFSRFPLTDARMGVLRNGAKDSLQATLELDNRLIGLTAVHLQRVDAFPGLGSGPMPLLRAARGFATDARDAAVNEVVPLLRREGGTQVLVGDFNLTPTSQAHQRLSAELQDAFYEAGWGLGHTYPTVARSPGLVVSFPLVRIDYIFHSRDLVASRAWVGADGGSDHLPVIADLAFR
jgi:vancomycin resistance protein VanJ